MAQLIVDDNGISSFIDDNGAAPFVDNDGNFTGPPDTTVMLLRFRVHASWIILAIGISLGLFVATS